MLDQEALAKKRQKDSGSETGTQKSKKSFHVRWSSNSGVSAQATLASRKKVKFGKHYSNQTAYQNAGNQDITLKIDSSHSIVIQKPVNYNQMTGGV